MTSVTGQSVPSASQLRLVVDAPDGCVTIQRDLNKLEK